MLARWSLLDVHIGGNLNTTLSQSVGQTAWAHLEVVLGDAELLQDGPASLPGEAVVPLLPRTQQQVVISRLVQKSARENLVRSFLKVKCIEEELSELLSSHLLLEIVKEKFALEMSLSNMGSSVTECKR